MLAIDKSKLMENVDCDIKAIVDKAATKGGAGVFDSSADVEKLKNLQQLKKLLNAPTVNRVTVPFLGSVIALHDAKELADLFVDLDYKESAVELYKVLSNESYIQIPGLDKLERYCRVNNASFHGAATFNPSSGQSSQEPVLQTDSSSAQPTQETPSDPVVNRVVRVQTTKPMPSFSRWRCEIKLENAKAKIKELETKKIAGKKGFNGSVEYELGQTKQSLEKLERFLAREESLGVLTGRIDFLKRKYTDISFAIRSKSFEKTQNNVELVTELSIDFESVKARVNEANSFIFKHKNKIGDWLAPFEIEEFEASMNYENEHKQLFASKVETFLAKVENFKNKYVSEVDVVENEEADLEEMGRSI